MNDNNPTPKEPLIEMSERLKTALKQLGEVSVFEKPSEENVNDIEEKKKER